MKKTYKENKIKYIGGSINKTSGCILIIQFLKRKIKKFFKILYTKKEENEILIHS